MKKCRIYLASLVFICCFCSGLSLPVRATNLNMELIIQPKQCLLDTTATGLQPTITLSPEDCIKGLPGLLAPLEQPHTEASSTGAKTPQATSTTSPTTAKPTPNPNALRDKVIAVLIIAVSVAVVVVTSVDSLFLNRRLTGTVWRQLRRLMSLIQNSGN